MISLEDKKNILGREPARTPPNIFDCDRGAPLYWGERQPTDLWQDLLFCVDAKFVVDFSPGSGSCARACLELGIEYRGICRTDLHQAWLANVADRDACSLITSKGSSLFEDDLAEMVKKHFEEVLEQSQERAKAKDHDPGSDDEV